MKTKMFNRKKTKWADEAAALADVLEKNSVTADQLQAAHTANQFTWKLITADQSENQFPVVRYSKTDFSEKEAIEAAMTDLGDITEGNLLSDHTVSDYVFTKVRG